ncbi:hypothetical protein POL68_31815 [Stigmatella sp. ncwal1]|uniref:Uncharacterized protein n=1 Tax=Stigmatella ashevillensis TaxID=2995309 RepID=A0ABT5DHJ3_9BACT|nr:hypothetical protein [Stigmatella ashevillena]MDC0713093.1 hypothetical protein [Stigmatella ashevillena]
MLEKHYGTAEQYDRAALLQNALDPGKQTPFHRLLARALLAEEVISLKPNEPESRSLSSVCQMAGLTDRDIQPNSFRNPLGFLVFNLFFNRETLERMSVHIWEDGFRVVQSEDLQVHSHRFPFRSWILRGELTNEVYDVRPTERDSGQKLFRIVYDQFRQSELNNTGTSVEYALAQRRTFHQGATYFMGTGEYHHTEVPQQDYTVTVFHTQTSASPSTPYVVGPSAEALYSFDRVTGLDSDVVAGSMTRLLSKLS